MNTDTKLPTSAHDVSVTASRTVPRFPVSAGVLLGLGLGGFFDGIVLHQILQWHHMLTSAGYPADSVENLEINTLADGLFHASTYIFVVWGLIILWRQARLPHFRWSTALFVYSVLIGFGLFNLSKASLTTTCWVFTTSTKQRPRTNGFTGTWAFCCGAPSCWLRDGRA